MAKRNNTITIDRPTVTIYPDGRATATADAIQTLEAIGIARGVYFHEDKSRDMRIIEEAMSGKTLLVVQEDVSRHGSPSWHSVRTLSDDPAVIKARKSFLETLRLLRAL